MSALSRRLLVRMDANVWSFTPDPEEEANILRAWATDLRIAVEAVADDAGAILQRAERAETMLRELQRLHYHEPDSDFMEYCVGCQRSPYNQPPHAYGCIVTRLAALLNESRQGSNDPW